MATKDSKSAGRRRTSAKKTAPATKAKTKATAAKKAPAKRAKASKASKPPQKQRRISREDLFAQEYLVDLNGRQAAIRAGYSPKSARQTACDLLATPTVQAKIKAAMDERAARVGIAQDDVLRRLEAIATADPRDLIEVYRCCCRYCWGKDHRFQFTPRELEEARREWERKVGEATAKADAEGKDIGDIAPFDEAGGTGFNPFHDPNPDCPECFGVGEERVLAKDTRDLSPEARLLYAGAEVTQHGLKIKMHDQRGTLLDIGKHLGMFAKNVNVKGDMNHNHKGLADVLDEIDGAGTGIPGRGDDE